MDIGVARGEIQIETGQAISSLQGLGAALRSADQMGAGAMQQTGMQIQQTGLAFQQAGRVGIGIGTAFAAPMVMAAKAAMGFESQMAGVNAVMDITDSQFEQLSHMASQLGQDSIFSGEQAAAGIETLGKAGLDAEDILGGAAKGVVDLAAASGSSTTKAAEVMAAALTQFELGGDQAEHVADVITGAANSSLIDINDFGIGLAQVGGIASAAGMSFEETAAYMALMGDMGLSGSDAATSMKTAILALLSPTDKAAGLMEQWGIDVLDATGNFVGLEGASREFLEAWEGSGQTMEEFMKPMEDIVGRDAVRAIIAGMQAIQNEGSETAKGWDDYMDAVNDVGAAERIATDRMDSTAGALERLRGSLSVLGERLGAPILSALRPVIEIADRLVDAFANLPAPVLAAVAAITSLAAAFTLIGGAGLFAAGHIVEAIGRLTAVGISMTSIGATISGLIPIILAVAAAFAVLGIAWENDFLGLRTATEEFFGGIKNTFNESKEIAADLGMDGLIADFYALGAVLRSLGMTDLAAMFTKGAQAARDFLDIREKIEDSMKEDKYGKDVGLKGGMIDPIGADTPEAEKTLTFLDHLRANLEAGAQAADKWIGKGNGLSKTLRNLNKGINAFDKEWNNINDMGYSGINAAVSAFGEFLKAIGMEGLGNAVAGISSHMIAFEDGMRNLIAGGMNPFSAAVTSLGEQIQEVTGLPVAQTMAEWALALDQGISVMENAVQNGLSPIEGILLGISYAARSLGFGDFADQMFAASQAAGVFGDSYQAATEQGLNPFHAAALSLADALDFLAGEETGASEAIRNIASTITDFVDGIQPKIEQFAQTWQDTYDQWRFIGEGPLQAGIRATAAAFGELLGIDLSGPAQGIVDFTNTLSTLLAQLIAGDWSGAAESFKSAVDQVVGAVQGLNIPQIVVNIGGFVLGSIAQTIDEFISGLFGDSGTPTNGDANGIGTNREVGSGAQSAGYWINGIIINIGEWAQGTIADIAAAVGPWIEEKKAAAAEALETIIDAVKVRIGGWSVSLAEGARDILTAVKEWAMGGSYNSMGGPGERGESGTNTGALEIALGAVKAVVSGFVAELANGAMSLLATIEEWAMGGAGGSQSLLGPGGELTGPNGRGGSGSSGALVQVGEITAEIAGWAIDAAGLKIGELWDQIRALWESPDVNMQADAAKFGQEMGTKLGTWLSDGINAALDAVFSGGGGIGNSEIDAGIASGSGPGAIDFVNWGDIIGTFIDSAVSGLSEAIGPAVERLKQQIGPLFEEMKTNIWNWIKEDLSKQPKVGPGPIWAAIDEWLIGGIGNEEIDAGIASGSGATATDGIVQALVEKLKEIPNLLLAALGDNLFQPVADWFGQQFSQLGSQIYAEAAQINIPLLELQKLIPEALGDASRVSEIEWEIYNIKLNVNNAHIEAGGLPEDIPYPGNVHIAPSGRVMLDVNGASVEVTGTPGFDPNVNPGEWMPPGGVPTPNLEIKPDNISVAEGGQITAEGIGSDQAIPVSNIEFEAEAPVVNVDASNVDAQFNPGQDVNVGMSGGRLVVQDFPDVTIPPSASLRITELIKAGMLEQKPSGDIVIPGTDIKLTVDTETLHGEDMVSGIDEEFYRDIFGQDMPQTKQGLKSTFLQNVQDGLSNLTGGAGGSGLDVGGFEGNALIQGLDNLLAGTFGGATGSDMPQMATALGGLIQKGLEFLGGGQATEGAEGGSIGNQVMTSLAQQIADADTAPVQQILKQKIGEALVAGMSAPSGGESAGGDAASGIGTSVATSLASAIGSADFALVGSAISTKIGAALQTGMTTAGGQAGGAGAAGGAGGGIGASVVTSLTSALTGANFGPIGEAISTKLGEALATVKGEGLATALQGVFDALAASATSLAASLAPVGAAIIQGIASGTGTATATLQSAVSAVISATAASATGIATSSSPPVGTAFVTGSAAGVGPATGTFQSAVDAMVQAVVASASATASGSAPAVGTAFAEGAGQGVGPATGTFISAVEAMVNAAIDAGIAAAGRASEIGASISAGAAAGIDVEALVGPAVQMVEAAINAANNRAENFSPSHVFREIGGWLSEGAALGVQDNTPMVAKAARGMVEAAINETDGLKDIGKNMSASTKEVNQDLKGITDIADILDKAPGWSNFGDQLRGSAEGIKDTVAGMREDVKDLVKSVKEQLKDMTAEFRKQSEESGSAISEGISSGSSGAGSGIGGGIGKSIEEDINRELANINIDSLIINRDVFKMAKQGMGELKGVGGELATIEEIASMLDRAPGWSNFGAALREAAGNIEGDVGGARDKFRDITKEMNQISRDQAKALKDIMKELATTIGALAKSVGESAGSGMAEGMASGGEEAKTAGSDMAYGSVGAIQDTIANLKGNLSNIGMGAGQALGGGMQKTAGEMTEVGNEVGTALGDGATQGLEESMGTANEAAGVAGSAMGDSFTGGVAGSIPDAMQLGSQITGAVLESLRASSIGDSEAVRMIGEAFGSAFGQGVTAATPEATQAGVGLTDATEAGMTAGLPGAQNTATGVGSDIGSGLGAGIESACKPVNTAARDITSECAGGGIESAEKGAVSAAENTGEEIGDGLGDGMDAAGRDVMREGKALGTDAVISVQDAINNNAVKMKTAITSMVAKSSVDPTADAKPVGTEFINGMVDGLNNQSSTLYDTVKKIVEAAIQKAKDEGEISSPSKVFMEIGDYMGQGLAMGIANQEDPVVASMGRVMESAIDAAHFGEINAGSVVFDQVGSSLKGTAREIDDLLQKSTDRRARLMESYSSNKAGKDAAESKRSSSQTPLQIGDLILKEGDPGYNEGRGFIDAISRNYPAYYGTRRR